MLFLSKIIQWAHGEVSTIRHSKLLKTKTKCKWKPYSGHSEIFVVSLLPFLDPTAVPLLMRALCGVALPLPLYLARY